MMLSIIKVAAPVSPSLTLPQKSEKLLAGHPGEETSESLCGFHFNNNN